MWGQGGVGQARREHKRGKQRHASRSPVYRWWASFMYHSLLWRIDDLVCNYLGAPRITQDIST